MHSILHIDMNAFFASVEQRANPSLRGKAMAVIGSKHRGVILSPSYEARAFGVKTGMTYSEAKTACSDIVLVPADPTKYSSVCEELIAIWRDFSPFVDLFSIDEAFLDVTGCEQLFGDPLQVAIAIKERVWNEKGLLCSVGIGPNKLLAKLGSDLLKPDGLVLIAPDDAVEILENLPVRSLCGIGPHLERALALMGIKTCGELGRTPLSTLVARFGIVGKRLQDMGRGIDEDPVIPLELVSACPVKSMGHSMTLADDCIDTAILERHILQLAEKVGRRLRRDSYSGRTVSLTLRYDDFFTFSRQKNLRHPVNHSLDIYACAREILRVSTLTKPVRLVGVSVSGLERGLMQMPLFEDDRKRKSISDVMDDINERYGDFTVTWGTLTERYSHDQIISPSWRPGRG